VVPCLDFKKPHGSYPNFNPVFVPIEDHGTLHVSAIDQDGLAVAATTTVNLFFGCKTRGRRTGITFNDGMDDFSESSKLWTTVLRLY